MTSAIASALAAAVALAAAATAWAETQPSAAPTGEAREKCYGIAKAGRNDCKAAGHACAGWAMADADPASFLLLPAGTCAKIVGGSLTPGA